MKLPSGGHTGTLIAGKPGTTWTNRTKFVHFQRIVKFRRSCAYCIVRANLIAREWIDIPAHENCSCRLRPIYPGQTSLPFIDIGARIARMRPSARRRVMGKNLYKLVESGMVDLADVSEDGRVLSLRDVAERKGLTEGQLQKAGVTEGLAEAVALDAETATAARQKESKAEQFKRSLARLRRSLGSSEPTPKQASKFKRALDFLRSQLKAG